MINFLRERYWALLRKLPPGPAGVLRRVIGSIRSSRLVADRLPPPKLNSGQESDVRLVCVVWDAPEEELASVVGRLAPLARGRPAQVLVVANRDAFHLFRDNGCRFEFIPPREDFQAHFPDRDHDRFALRRIESIVETYAPARVLLVGRPSEELLGGLAASTLAP